MKGLYISTQRTKAPKQTKRSTPQKARTAVRSWTQRFLWGLALGSVGLALPTTAHALPSGGNVVVGNAAINTTGAHMTITGQDASANVGITWQNFDVARGEQVTFNTMNSVLNYVTGPTVSNINGVIDGDAAKVYIVNPNGIIVGDGASINVNSLVLSTRSLNGDIINQSVVDTLGTMFDSAPADGTVTKEVLNTGTLKVNELLVEGDRVVLKSKDTVKTKANEALTAADKANYILRGKEVAVGYEVAKNGTISIGDGEAGTQQSHTISNYATGVAADGATKGSTVFTAQNLNAGDNTVNDYMLIHDVYELQAMNTKLDGNYMLANDIDASGTANWNDENTDTNTYEGFKPVGEYEWIDSDPWYNRAKAFTGTFDGLDHTVQALNIKRPSMYNVGVWGVIGGPAVIRNLGLVGGSVEGKDYVGSLVGLNLGTITNTYARGAVTGTDFVGGLVGQNKHSITNAYATGAVEGGSFVGGLVGENYNMITNAYATGAVTGQRHVGGLVGINYSTITNAYATGAVTGTGYYVGGLVGYGRGTITNAYAMGAVTGQRHVGGLVGINYSTITNAYATGAVTGTGYYVGGLVGYGRGTITNAYAMGAVTGLSYVGGLVGINYSTITNAYYGERKDMSKEDQPLKPDGTSTGKFIAYGGDTTAISLKEMNASFKNSLGGEANNWKVYTDGTTPLLKHWLTPLKVTGLIEEMAEELDNSGNTSMIQKTYAGANMPVGSWLTYDKPNVEANKVLSWAKNAGMYTNLVDTLYSTQDGYDITTGTMEENLPQLTINKANLTLTANDQEVIYGTPKEAAETAATMAVSGLVGADEGKSIFTLDGANPNGTITYTVDGIWLTNGHTNNAGTTGTVAIDSVTGLENLTNYNTPTPVAGTLTVVKKPITLKVDDVTLEYGSTTAPTYTLTAEGMVYGETVAAAAQSGTATLSSDGWVGRNGRYTNDVKVKDGGYDSYAIIANKGTLAFTNYSFNTIDNGALTITPKTITLGTTINNGNDFTYTYGDVQGSTATTGNDAVKYDVTGLVNGDTVASLSNELTFTNTAVQEVEGAWRTKDVVPGEGAQGPKAAYELQVTLASSNHNYILTDNPTWAKITVAPKTITITPDSVSEVTYGSLTAPSVTYTHDDLVYGDSWDNVKNNISFTSSGIFTAGESTARENGSFVSGASLGSGNVKTTGAVTGGTQEQYEVTAHIGANNLTNYNFVGKTKAKALQITPYTGAVTVTPTITNDSAYTYTYGNGGNSEDKDTYKLTYTGLVNGDTQLAAVNSEAFTNSAFKDGGAHTNNVGNSYTLSYDKAALTNGNYTMENVTVASPTVTIEKATAKLIVPTGDGASQAQPKEIVYGSTNAKATIDGLYAVDAESLANGDTDASGLQGAVTYNTNGVLASGSGTPGKVTGNVGDYAMTMTNVGMVTSDNYNFVIDESHKTAYVKITPATLKVKTTINRSGSHAYTYGDTSQGTLGVVNTSDLVNGDAWEAVKDGGTFTNGAFRQVDTTTETNNRTKNAGTTQYTLTWALPANSNYVLSTEANANSWATATVTPKAVTITPDRVTSVAYGSKTAPTVTYKVDGLVYGENPGDVGLAATGTTATTGLTFDKVTFTSGGVFTAGTTEGTRTNGVFASGATLAEETSNVKTTGQVTSTMATQYDVTAVVDVSIKPTNYTVTAGTKAKALQITPYTGAVTVTPTITNNSAYTYTYGNGGISEDKSTYKLTYAGLVNGDTQLAAINSEAFTNSAFKAGGAHTNNVGNSYTLSYDKAALTNGNYTMENVTVASPTVTIEKATAKLIVPTGDGASQAQPKEIVYGSTNAKATIDGLYAVDAESLANGDTDASGLQGAVTYNTNGVLASGSGTTGKVTGDVGDYTMTMTGVGTVTADNYNFVIDDSHKTAYVKITPATVDVKTLVGEGASATYTYGDTAHGEYSAVAGTRKQVNGDSWTDVLSGAAYEGAFKTVTNGDDSASELHTKDASETPYDVTLTLGNGNYRLGTTTWAKETIKPKEITITPQAVGSLTYGSTTAPNFSFSHTDLAYGETWNADTGVTTNTSGITGTVTYTSDGWLGNRSQNGPHTGKVGSYAITSDITGLSATNYTFKSATTANGLTITPADLTLTVQNSSTTYGTAPTYSYTVGTLANGDVVGTTIDPTTGNTLQNTLTDAISYTYIGAPTDGRTTADATEGTANANGYAITGTIASDALHNYNIKVVNTGKLTIQKAEAPTITTYFEGHMDGGKSYVYGATADPSTYKVTVTGLVNGDTTKAIADVSKFTNNAFVSNARDVHTQNVGTGYALSYDTAGWDFLKNYNPATVTKATAKVTPADLTLTVQNSSTTYGTAPTYSYTVGTLANGDVVGITIDPTTGNTLQNTLTDAISYTYIGAPTDGRTTADATEGTANANGYAITGTIASDALHNYNIKVVNTGKLTIQKAEAPTITTYFEGHMDGGKSYVYGATADPSTYKVTVTGLVNGDTTKAIADVSKFTNNAFVSNARDVHTQNVGTGYALSYDTAGWDFLKNYNPATVTKATAKVTPADLTLTVQNSSTTYGTAPAYSYTVGTLANGDVVGTTLDPKTGKTLGNTLTDAISYTYAGAPTDGRTTADATEGTSNAGGYAITGTIPSNALHNYNIKVVNTGKLTIQKAEAPTITTYFDGYADGGKSYVYGATADPSTYKVTVTGLVNGDAMPTVDTTKFTNNAFVSNARDAHTKNVGTGYALSYDTNDWNFLSNYKTATVTNATASVTQAPLTIETTMAHPITYGDKENTALYGVTVTGLVNGDTRQTMPGVFHNTAYLADGRTADAGTYQLEYYFTDPQVSANYAIRKHFAEVALQKATLPIDVSKPIVIGSGSTALPLPVEGLTNGDDKKKGLLEPITFTGTIDAMQPGSYTGQLGLNTEILQTNYDVQYIGGTPIKQGGQAYFPITVVVDPTAPTYHPLNFGTMTGTSYLQLQPTMIGLANGERLLQEAVRYVQYVNYSEMFPVNYGYVAHAPFLNRDIHYTPGYWQSVWDGYQGYNPQERYTLTVAEPPVRW